MKEKYAFFLDIDGTLLSPDGKISTQNIQAVNEAVSKGHYVFICSGRSYPKVGEYIINAANWSGIIASIGAEIIMNGKFIRQETVSDSFAKRAAAELLDTGIWALMGNCTGCFKFTDFNNDGQKPVESIADFNKNLKGITKIDLAPVIPQSLELLLKEEMDVIHHAHYTECGIKGISKSEGIRFVLEKIKIPHENCVAVGDSLNDTDMIKFAGIGVAMGNALPEVKAVSDRITASNTESGVAKIINEITKEN